MDFARVYIIGLGVFGRLLLRRVDEFYGAGVRAFDKGDKLEFAEATAEHPNLIIIAVPIKEIPGVLKEVVAMNPAHTWITEIGSVKGELCSTYESIVNGKMPFVSSHPMTGPLDTLWHEWDWKRKCLMIADGPEISRTDVRFPVVEFWEKLGFLTRTISAHKHDKVIGTLSHLSHFMILAYDKFVREQLTADEIDLAGTSFEKFSAMAKGAARLGDIYESNDALNEIVQEFAGHLALSIFKIQFMNKKPKGE